MVQTSLKLGKFGLWPYIWPWRSMSIAEQDNSDIDQVVLHLWSKFSDPSMNRSRVIIRGQTSDWHTDWHTHGPWHTHTQAQATTTPEGQNWPRVIKWSLRVSFRKMRLKGSSAKWRPFCLGLNVLNVHHGRKRTLFQWWPFSFFVGAIDYYLVRNMELGVLKIMTNTRKLCHSIFHE